MDNKPILYPYFLKTADVLLAEYNRSKEQNASSNLGKNREYFCKEFLSKVLPPKLFIKSGEIWDSQNNKTGQINITVLRDDAPSLHIGSDDIYLAEGVFGVIEVKSNLTREKFIEAGETLTKVANLKNNAGATIIDEINKKDWKETFDLICILNRGVLLRKGRILNWSTDQEFMVVNSKSASLGYLYLYLVSYGTSFLGRGMILNPYFEPFNNWDDN